MAGRASGGDAAPLLQALGASMHKASTCGLRPLAVPRVAELAVGHTLTDDLIAALADAAFPFAKPMDNTDYELVWRKKMIKPLVTYALRELRGDDTRELRRKIARQMLT